MTTDRLAWIRVQGLRSIVDVRLELGGLTVLIGENGSGKSTLVEAFEILRKVGEVVIARDAPLFGDTLTEAHHGMEMLLRKGAPRLVFAVGIRLGDAEDSVIEYSFALRSTRGGLIVDEERLAVAPTGGMRQPVIDRSSSSCTLHGEKSGTLSLGPLPKTDLALHFAIRNFRDAELHPYLRRVLDVFSAGEVHLPFETRPLWLCAERDWTSPIRDLAVVNQATHLERLGVNLTNAYAHLKNGDRWEECLDFLRLTIGADLKDVKLAPAARGKHELQLKFSGLPDAVSVATLSDGNLTALAFGAMFYMERERSFLVIDEPESHLHPAVISRVTAELERLAEGTPIVIATQSDRLLDALTDPVKSTIVCELDPRARATRLVRLDADKLARWKDRYSGLGTIRAEGLMDLVTAEASAE